MSRYFFRILVLFLIGVIIFSGIKFYYSFKRIVHDKSINANVLQRLYEKPDIPLGTAVAPANRWASNAFIAERQADGIAVLILDDHYRGDDPAYRSASGVIGDEISNSLLCSLRAQATAQVIVIDPVVSTLIEAKCGRSADDRRRSVRQRV